MSRILDNIILFIATYEKDNYLHLVFPYVERSLQDLLGENKDGPIAVSQVPENWLWTEFRGVVRAISYFHGQLGNDRFERPIRALHFDLKPANILVTNNNKLKIIDFGEAFLLPSEAQPSEPPSRYGTGDPTYQAPEIYDPDYIRELILAVDESLYGDDSATVTTTTAPLKAVLLNYDVWQLACIMLLILTYLIEGPERVAELHEERKRKPSATFFKPGSPGSPPKAVRGFIKRKWEALESKYPLNTGHIRARIFLGDVRELADQMFQVDPSKRVGSSNADARLKRIHCRFLRPWELELSKLINAELTPASDEENIFQEVKRPSRKNGSVSMSKM